MSKKHPGINEWKKHIQLGRRKPGQAQAAEEQVTDARKPPGWRSRADKAKDRRPGSPTKAAAPPAKSPQSKPATTKTATSATASVPSIAPPKRGLERPVDGEGRPYITLVQFIKTIAAVDTGGAGKHAIRAGGFLVNGVEELRPGRKLHTGDVVTVAGVEHPVTV